MSQNKCAIFIPARSGSKGIKNKNVKLFYKKPLIYWTIIQARKTIFKNHVYVSSDSDKILNIAENNKCIPIKRPKNISKDNSSIEEAIQHFIKNNKKFYQYLILLQPTSPLRHSYDIENSFNLIIKENKNSLFSASFFSDITLWEKKTNIIEPYNYDTNNRLPRQKSAGFYMENGSIYIFKTSTIIKNMNRIDDKSVSCYLMNKMQSFEIDSIDDFKLCEKIFKKKIY